MMKSNPTSPTIENTYHIYTIDNASYPPLPSDPLSRFDSEFEFFASDKKDASANGYDGREKIHDEYRRRGESTGAKESWRRGTTERVDLGYRPIPFRVWFTIGIVGTMVALSAAMEILLAISVQRNGFTNSLVTSNAVYARYFYTIMAVVFSLPVVGAWTWYDYYVKAAQPYIDLKIGSATADRTLLINYTSYSNFFVPVIAVRNKHYLTLVSAVLCLLTLAISPIAASLFFIQDVALPAQTVIATSIAQLGYSDLQSPITAVAGASGFVLAQAFYDVPWPKFFNPDGAVTPFLQDLAWGKNGSMSMNTIAVKTPNRCQSTTSTILQNIITALSTTGNCSASITLSSNTTAPLFGIQPANCTGDRVGDVRFASVAFWSTLGASPNVVICSPTMEVNVVSATISLGTGGVKTVTISALADASNPLLAPPLNGQPFNGIFFPSTIGADADDSAGRLSAAQKDFAVAFSHKMANASLLDTDGRLQPTAMLGVVSPLYRNYLNAFAASTYFTASQVPQSASLMTTQPRLKVGAFAAHMLASLFALLALLGAFLIVAHSRARRGLVLAGEPGTIASAVSIAGGSELSYLIEAKDRPDVMAKLLRNHRFKMDPKTGRIVVNEEMEGLSATTTQKRKSFLRKSRLLEEDDEVDEVLRERKNRHSLSMRATTGG